MTEDFPAALGFVLLHEGGYSDDPQDAGGATNLGVTQRVYNAWRTDHGEPVQSVRHITRPEAAAIYRERYWRPVRGDELPAPVALALFDFAVNAGVSVAIRTLQRAVNAAEDGIFGPRTMAGVSAMNPHHLAVRICDLRMEFYYADIRHHPSQQKFLKGWAARVDALRRETLTL